MRNVNQQRQLERGGEETAGIAVGTVGVRQARVGMPVDTSPAAAMVPPATSEGVTTLWVGAAGAELVLATMVVVAGRITRMHAIIETKPTVVAAAVATVEAAAAATVAPIMHNHRRTPQRLCRPFHRRRSGGAPPHCTTRHRRHRPAPGSNGERVGSYTCLG